MLATGCFGLPSAAFGPAGPMSFLIVKPDSVVGWHGIVPAFGSIGAVGRVPAAGGRGSRKKWGIGSDAWRRRIPTGAPPNPRGIAEARLYRRGTDRGQIFAPHGSPW